MFESQEGYSPQQDEVARLTRELALLTQVIERQSVQRLAAGEPSPLLSADMDESRKLRGRFVTMKAYVLQILDEVITAAVDEVRRAQAAAGMDNLEPPHVTIERIVAQTKLLDETWYLLANEDVAQENCGSLHHYSRFGLKERRPPNVEFS